MEDNKYDVVVLGGGPAGYAAAMRAIDFGKRVCLIEKVKSVVPVYIMVR